MRALLALAAARVVAGATHYYLDDSDGAGPEFQGIGGLSGGGATSVFLRSYPEAIQQDILNLLFGPEGAALHILKVEIGSSAQSTDGSEATHAQSPTDLDYHRGYEWRLMTQAKSINPNIRLYGLPWGFPQWVSCNPKTPMSNCTDSPYSYSNQTAHYVTSWLQGARDEYDLDIDWVGIWNERGSNNDYIHTLRQVLNTEGFGETGIVAADGDWSIATDCLANATVCNDLFALGVHYPGTVSSPDALASGKILMASEDDSTLNNNVGTGCWARLLNQNYVVGNMTGSIAWNLLAAYPKGTQWYRASLMNALQPWSGSYQVTPKIWVTAHTAQFAQPGYRYLKNSTAAIGLQGTGSGRLAMGGSYVTLQHPTKPSVWATVIEKMSHDHSPCVRPDLPPYDVQDEIGAVFELGGGLLSSSPAVVYGWITTLSFGPDTQQTEFESLGAIPVVNGRYIVLNVTVDSVITISPQDIGRKGVPANAPPAPQQFPTAYTDDLQACPPSDEGKYWSDQNGSFQCEVDPSNASNIIMRQITPLRPITWSGDLRPHSLLGSRDMVNSSFSVSVAFDTPSGSAIIGSRGSGTDDTLGFLWAVDASGNYNVTTSMMVVDWRGITKPLIQGTLPLNALPIAPNTWHRFRVDVNGTSASAWVDGVPVFQGLDFTNSSGPNGVPRSGFGGIIGTVRYGQYTAFDDFELYSSYFLNGGSGNGGVAAGAPVKLVSCWTEVGYLKGSGWTFNPLSPGASNGTFSSRDDPSLCITLVPQNEQPGQTLPWPVILSPCSTTSTSNPPDATQVWSQQYNQLYDTTISNPSTGRCLDIYQQQADVGTAIDAWPCNPTNQWYYDYEGFGQIMDVNNVVCLGV